MQFREFRALAATSGGDMIIGVMCTLGGAQATEQAAQLGLFLMCRLRSEEYQSTDFNKSPPDMVHKSVRKVDIRTNAHSFLAYFFSDSGSMILRVSD